MIEIKNVRLTLQINEILKSAAAQFECRKIHRFIGRNGI